MSNWKKIVPEEITKNPFQLIGKDWALVTAGNQEKVNTMTISWGGVGVMWGKPVAFVFIRPQRYTKEFIDAQEELSLSFYDEKYRDMLSFMGSKSGRDLDKIKEMGLTLNFEKKVPYFEEANMVLSLKKLYKQDLTKESFLDTSCITKWYANNDYHTMYVCEITDVQIAE